MNETRYNKVAGHLFSVTVDGCLLDGTAAGNLDGNAAEPQGDFFAKCMDNYEPFAECQPGQGAGVNVFSLSVLPPAAFDYTEEITLTEEEAETYVLTVTAASPAFRRKIRRLLPDGS